MTELRRPQCHPSRSRAGVRAGAAPAGRLVDRVMIDESLEHSRK